MQQKLEHIKSEMTDENAENVVIPKLVLSAVPLPTSPVVTVPPPTPPPPPAIPAAPPPPPAPGGAPPPPPGMEINKPIIPTAPLPMLNWDPIKTDTGHTIFKVASLLYIVTCPTSRAGMCPTSSRAGTCPTSRAGTCPTSRAGPSAQNIKCTCLLNRHFLN